MDGFLFYPAVSITPRLTFFETRREASLLFTQGSRRTPPFLCPCVPAVWCVINLPDLVVDTSWTRPPDLGTVGGACRGFDFQRLAHRTDQRDHPDHPDHLDPSLLLQVACFAGSVLTV